MKRLTLLRHAKAGWDDPALRDFDRPLTARGRKAACAMGRAIRTEGLSFDRILASPAARTTETIAGLTEGYGPMPAPHYDERVYLASAPTLLAIVRAADEAADRLLIVGHNPGLERLALWLSASGALRDRLALKYPTGALAEIVLPVAHWADIGPDSARLERFWCPRDLDPALGPDDD